MTEAQAPPPPPLAPPPPAPPTQLVVLTGAHRGDLLLIEEGPPLIFGTRVGASLPEPALAPVHCLLFMQEGRCFLQDLGSEAGTWLEGKRLENILPLQPGESFRIGETELAYQPAVLPERGRKLTERLDPVKPAPQPPELETRPAPELEEQAAGASEDPPARKKKTQRFTLEVPELLKPPADPLRPQDSLGSYDILKVLGEGSQGTVYKAFDRNRRRVVALKLLKIELAKDPQRVARFLRGAKAGATLRHRDVVSTLGAGHAGGRIYVTMEYVDGLNLEAFCRTAGGRLAPRVALELLTRINEALVFAHAHRILHRNLSPSNILISSSGQPKLADLAEAKRLGSKQRVNLAASVQLHPQSLYTPPEALLETTPLDERSDVYGVGACLFRALNGVAPYGQSRDKVALRQLDGRLEAMSPLQPVSSELTELLRRCLAADPDDRFPANRDLREALAELPDTSL